MKSRNQLYVRHRQCVIVLMSIIHKAIQELNHLKETLIKEETPRRLRVCICNELIL